MIRRELGVLVVVAVLGTYWLVCAVMVAHNLAHRPGPVLVTPATAPGSVPVIAHLEEGP